MMPSLRNLIQSAIRYTIIDAGTIIANVRRMPFALPSPLTAESITAITAQSSIR